MAKIEFEESEEIYRLCRVSGIDPKSQEARRLVLNYGPERALDLMRLIADFCRSLKMYH